MSGLVDRRAFVGGSDARVIMGDDEAALLRLWREKRGEVKPEDLSENLIVQLGKVTEELNRRWYRERYSGCPKADPAPGAEMDGGHARWRGRSRWGGF
jgi:predicted phage-related endonuclease